MRASLGAGAEMKEKRNEECRQFDMELDGALSRQDVSQTFREPSEKAVEHLLECEQCRRLYHWLMECGLPPQPLPAVAKSVQAKLKQSLAPVTPQSSPQVLAAQFLLAFLLLSAPMIGRMGTTGLHELNRTQLLGVIAVLVCGAALLSFSLAWQMSPGSLHRVSPKVVVPILSAGFLAATAVLFPWRPPHEFFERGWPCLKAGLMIAAPTSLLFWLMARRGVAVSGGTFGTGPGALAGLLGVFVLQLACSHMDATHLFFWHGGVLIVPAVLGMAVVWGARRGVRPERRLGLQDGTN